MRALGAPLVVLFALALALAVASGCVLIDPLDGLDGNDSAGPSDAAGIDGARGTDAGGTGETGSGDGAAGSDVVTDAAAEDGALADTGGDAIADAASPVDSPVTPDGPSPFCASLSPAPTLCEDFDEGTAFDAKFTTKFVASTAHLGADGAYARSPADSLFSNTDPSTPMINSYGYVSKVFPGTGTRLELAFDVLLVQTVNGQDAVTAALIVNDGQATQHQLAFVLGNVDRVEESFASADGGEIFLDTPLALAPSVGTWSRVDVVLSLPQRTVTVTVDGKSSLNAAPLDPSWPASGALTVDVGIGYVSGTSGPWSIRYDDVVANPQ